MRIGIDARLINETGVGRYIRNLIDELSTLDSVHTYVVFLTKDSFETFQLPHKNWEKRIADVHWHTIKEQFVMPKVFHDARLDLIHVPYFNVPLFSRIPIIVTIHDLTVLHYATGKATTLPYVLYMLKRIGYNIVLRLGLLKAKHIITVSNTVKTDVVTSLGINPDKITVTYEGVDKKLLLDAEKKLTDSQFTKPYLLYVGNAYPHKNLSILLDAFIKLKQTKEGAKYQLVFVGSDTFFYTVIKQQVGKLSCKGDIIFTGSYNDEQLRFAYQHAYALVFPSLAEGFGLPALEAMQLGCPVICSDIPIFHEILNGAVTYFDPHNADSLVDAIIYMKKISKPIVDTVVSRYSWKTMAQQTRSVYERML